MNKKLIIIDGNSLLFRAYFATAYPGVEIMKTSTGIPTNAIFAFSNMINKIVSSLKENEGIFVAFDAGKPTFRHEALETYKANRKPAPAELVAQFPIAREFLDAIGIYQFEEEGFEGDDIAGTIAKKAEAKGWDVNIYTSDRDFLQLITDKISINVIRKGLSDVVVTNEQVMMDSYGFRPKQIIDYKGLRGDSSDNLPGIPGIGEKTAVKLINDYGDFDNIIAHASDIGGKLGQNILDNQEIGRISRDLAIIKTDVDIPFDVEDTIYRGYDFDKINTFCQKYEFKQLLSKISPKWKRTSESYQELNVEVLTSLKDISIRDEISVAIDLNGDNYTLDEVFGVAFLIDGHHIYMKIDDVKNDKKALDILKDQNIKKYCFDYKAIKVALHRYGIEINGCFFDLLIAAYLLDSSLNNDVDSILHFFGIDVPQNDDVSLFNEGDPQRTNQIALYSRTLYQRIKRELEKVYAFDLFSNLEIPLIDVLADMEIEGFPLDIHVLDEFGNEWKARLKELESEIHDLAGEKFNISSPKQVGDILFTKLGLPDYKKGSTSVEVLRDLRNTHPIVNKILEYRKYFKLITTYVDGLKPHVLKDGKVHAKFNQALTTTGRLSSSDPNLQNISIRDEEGKLLRKAFHYDDDSVSILSLDYSQIELRILASLSDCKGLQEVFESGEDIHAATAKKVFHLDGEPTDLERRRAKAVNFGIVYGISDWGLAEQLDIGPKEAGRIITDFYQTFPEVRTFFEKIINDVTNDGYVSTILGRRRYLREIHDSNYQKREFAKRAAMNAPIQGSAADLIKIAMIKVNDALKLNKLKTKMVLQIHDELIFKVPNEEKDLAFKIIKHEMENAINLKVKFVVDGGFGKSWYDAK